jgi:hypothetical protein
MYENNGKDDRIGALCDELDGCWRCPKLFEQNIVKKLALKMRFDTVVQAEDFQNYLLREEIC